MWDATICTIDFFIIGIFVILIVTNHAIYIFTTLGLYTKELQRRPFSGLTGMLHEKKREEKALCLAVLHHINTQR